MGQQVVRLWHKDHDLQGAEFIILPGGFSFGDYLRSGAYPGAAKLGRGEGYDYPHPRPDQVSPQDLLPPDVEGSRFYEPGEAEAELARRLAEIRRARGRDV